MACSGQGSVVQPELFEALVLHDTSVGERQALFERLDACSGRDLLVLDRGYPGSWLVAVLLARGVPFCMRCDSSSSFKAVKVFMQSGQEAAWARRVAGFFTHPPLPFRPQHRDYPNGQTLAPHILPGQDGLAVHLGY